MSQSKIAECQVIQLRVVYKGIQQQMLLLSDDYFEEVQARIKQAFKIQKDIQITFFEKSKNHRINSSTFPYQKRQLQEIQAISIWESGQTIENQYVGDDSDSDIDEARKKQVKRGSSDDEHLEGYLEKSKPQKNRQKNYMREASMSMSNSDRDTKLKDQQKQSDVQEHKSLQIQEKMHQNLGQQFFNEKEYQANCLANLKDKDQSQLSLENKELDPSFNNQSKVEQYNEEISFEERERIQSYFTEMDKNELERIKKTSIQEKKYTEIELQQIALKEFQRIIKSYQQEQVMEFHNHISQFIDQKQTNFFNRDS